METVKKAVAQNDILRVLRIKPFSFMMLSEFFSQFAFNMQNFALILIVYGLTHSNTAVSGIILSFTIPAILFSVIGGVYVDRWNKREVLFFTNLLRSFLLLFLLIPHIHLGLVYTLTFLIAVATQFFIPAESAIIPMLVPARLILSANSIFSIGIYGTMLLGYILSGPALLLLGRTYTINLLSALFFISALCVLFIKLSPKKKEEAEKPIGSQARISFARELHEMFFFIKRTKRVMHALLILAIAQSIIFMFGVLGPGYLETILKVGIENLSLVLIAPAAVGMGIGALALGSFGGKFKLKKLSALGFFISGIVFLLFPLGNRITSYGFIETINKFLPNMLTINILHIVIFLAVIMGFAISLVLIPSNATIQLETNEGIRGRIYGFLNTLIGTVSFLPVVLAGGLADLLGVGIVITSVGVIMLFLSVIFFVFE